MEVIKMLTRKDYRAKEDRKNELEDMFKNHKVLTNEEFNKLSTSEQFEYAEQQNALGLPVTQEMDTPYDEHYKTPSERAKESDGMDIEKMNDKSRRKAAIMDTLGLVAFVHLLGTIFRGGKS